MGEKKLVKPWIPKYTKKMAQANPIFKPLSTYKPRLKPEHENSESANQLFFESEFVVGVDLNVVWQFIHKNFYSSPPK